MSKLNKPLILISIITIIILSMIMFPSQKELSREEIYLSFILAENSGFDIEKGKLTLGAVKINQTAERKITVENKIDEDIKIIIEASGEAADYIIVSENNIILKPGESKEVAFIVEAIGITEFRKYEGEVIVISKKL